jgi:hypothetical protein
MAELSWPLLLAFLVAGVVVVWLVSANLAALARYRGALGGHPPSLSARVAWTLSVVAVLSGPLVVAFAALALVLGQRERRRVEQGTSTRRSRLPAEMALKNGAVVLVGTALLSALVWLAWRLG